MTRYYDYISLIVLVKTLLTFLIWNLFVKVVLWLNPLLRMRKTTWPPKLGTWCTKLVSKLNVCAFLDLTYKIALQSQTDVHGLCNLFTSCSICGSRLFALMCNINRMHMMKLLSAITICKLHGTNSSCSINTWGALLYNLSVCCI